MKNTVTAIDFGTSKIVALVGETSGRQRCDIIGAGFAGYAGFADGQWNDPAVLNEAISTAVHEAEQQSREKQEGKQSFHRHDLLLILRTTAHRRGM